ncbi:hypothetical protein VCHA31O73_360006 [Vibrio chagasii]|nr:hypothetical protein VCHA31O73_360006 [Vibrio chagasii]
MKMLIATVFKRLSSRFLFALIKEITDLLQGRDDNSLYNDGHIIKEIVDTQTLGYEMPSTKRPLKRKA